MIRRTRNVKSRATRNAIAANKAGRAQRDLVLKAIDTEQVAVEVGFTIRDLRQAPACRKVSLSNLRRIVRSLIAEGDLVAQVVGGRRYALKVAA